MLHNFFFKKELLKTEETVITALSQAFYKCLFWEDAFSRCVYHERYRKNTLPYIFLSFIHSFFIHLVVCLTTGPKPLPKRAFHIVRSIASSLKWEYPLLSFRSSSSFLRLLPRLPVTSILPFIFRSITRCRRQLLRKIWPIQLAFRLLMSCRIFLCSLTLCNTSSFLIWSGQPRNCDKLNCRINWNTHSALGGFLIKLSVAITRGIYFSCCVIS